MQKKSFVLSLEAFEELQKEHEASGKRKDEEYADCDRNTESRFIGY